MRREHVELGRDAERQRPFERVAERVRVRVDQSRQQRPARAGDGLHAGRQRVADADDDAVAHVHVRARQHAFAVEHPDVADDELPGLLWRRDPRRRRPCRHHAAADECNTNDSQRGNLLHHLDSSHPRFRGHGFRVLCAWCLGASSARSARVQGCDVQVCKRARVQGAPIAPCTLAPCTLAPCTLAPCTSHLARLHPRTSSTQAPRHPAPSTFPVAPEASPMSDPRLVDIRRARRRARGRRTRRAR